MKKLISLFIIFQALSFAHATECSDYLKDMYSKKKEKIELKFKDEYVDKYEKGTNDNMIPAIVHGTGYMKLQDYGNNIPVFYICMMKNNGKVNWGYVILH